MRARILFTAALLGATTIVAPGAAQAHPAPFTVTAGSAPAGVTIQVSKVTTGPSPQLAFKDTTTGVNLSCASASLKGSITTGPTNGSPFVTLQGAATVLNGCTGPAGLKFAVTGFGTWSINISDSTNGVSTGTVTNLRLHVAATAGPTCSFDIGSNAGSFSSSGTSTVAPGTLAGTYTNSTQIIGIPPTNPGSLGIWNVHGSGTSTYCVSPSIIKQGDKASVSANFKLTADTPANNPIAVN